MGRVLLGAVVFAVVGGLLGAVPGYRGVTVQSPSGPLYVTEALQAISIMIGAAAGAVVGAIAGAVAAQPESRPIPRWVWVALLVLVLLAVVLVGLWFFWGSAGSAPKQAPMFEPQPR
jgi:hypothetical protein